MIDKQLQVLVHLVEVGMIPARPILLLVDGALIEGTVVSETSFADYLTSEILSKESPGDATSLNLKAEEILSGLAEEHDGQDQMVESAPIIPLINVAILMGQTKITRNALRVLLERVSAWDTIRP